MNLSQVKKGQTVVMKEISPDCGNVVKMRLLDLGFVPGTEITPQIASPFNDPVAYSIHNTLISLRQEDAKHIFVNLKTDEDVE